MTIVQWYLWSIPVLFTIYLIFVTYMNYTDGNGITIGNLLLIFGISLLSFVAVGIVLLAFLIGVFLENVLNVDVEDTLKIELFNLRK